LDDEGILAMEHINGAQAAQSPVMHVRRIAGGRLLAYRIEFLERACGPALPLHAQARAVVGAS
jgi:hypothetical protein